MYSINCKVNHSTSDDCFSLNNWANSVKNINGGHTPGGAGVFFIWKSSAPAGAGVIFFSLGYTLTGVRAKNNQTGLYFVGVGVKKNYSGSDPGWGWVPKFYVG